LARISCTGDAYLRRITGNLQAAGNIDLNNDLRITGTCTITGSLILNGITITGNGGNITNIDSGTTINNYYTTGSSSDFSTGDFTVSGILRVRSKAFITGYSAYILNVSGLNSAAPIVNISGNSPGNPALKIVNGGAEAVFFQGGHRGSSAGIGTTVTLNPLPTEMVFEDGLLISYT
jgi:hypothetical protein